MLVVIPIENSVVERSLVGAIALPNIQRPSLRLDRAEIFDAVRHGISSELTGTVRLR